MERVESANVMSLYFLREALYIPQCREKRIEIEFCNTGIIRSS